MSSDRKTLKKLLVLSAKGRQIIQMMGKKPADALFDVVLKNGMISLQIQNPNSTNTQVLGYVEMFLDHEILNWGRTCNVVTHLIQGVNRQTLHAVIATNTKAPGTYGVLGTDSDARKAARWICNASNSVQTNLNAQIGKVEVLITKYAQNGAASITKMSGLDKINKALMSGGGRHDARGPVIAPRSPLPSSMGGRALLQNAMIFLEGRTIGNANCGYLDLGCYLLGVAIGCHGFPDANGRTGRVLYAIAQIKGINAGVVAGPFAGLTVAGEELLHGLPAQG